MSIAIRKLACALALALLSAPAAFAQEAPLTTQIVDAFNKIYGSHPGFRANHAKGIVVEGHFKASPEAAKLSRAVLFNGSTIPVTVRFSDGGGLPTVPDADNPHAVITKLMSAVPSGSYLAMSDTTRDIDTQTMTTGAARYNAKLGSAVFTPRTGAEYARFFDGLSLVEPGLVPMPQWRPEPAADDAELIPMYAAVGHKP